MYEKVVQGMEDIAVQTAEGYLSEGVEKAVENSANVYPQSQLVNELEAQLDAMLEERSQSNQADMLDNIKEHTTIVYGCMVAFAGIMILACVIIIGTIANPAKNATSQLNGIISKIKSNQGDLTERIKVKTQDEIGQLVKGINSFIDELQGILCTIRNESDNMEVLANNIGNSIQNSNDNAGSISATMEQLSASMEEVSASLDKISSSSNGVLDSAQSISDKAKDGANFVKEVKNRAEDVKSATVKSKDSTNKMISDIRGILEKAIENSRSVENINALTEKILSISSQTNLLALNASIEAARAG